MLIIGASTLERADGDTLLNVIHTLVEHSPILSPEKNWNGFNILHKVRLLNIRKHPELVL